MRFPVRLVAALTLAVAIVAGAQPDADTLRSSSESAAGRLFDVDGMLIEEPLAQRAGFYFQMQEDLTTKFLDTHRSSSVKDLETYLSGIRKEMRAQAVSLNGNDTLVAITENGIGNLFVVRQSAKTSKIIWRARNERAKPTGWTALTNPRCSAGVFRPHCVPLSADSITSIGPGRVVVEATYLQYAGGTMGKRSLVPELDFIVVHAATVLREQDLGMIESWTVKHDGTRSEVCIQFDEGGYQVALRKSKNTYGVLHHRRLPDGESCAAETKP